MDLWEIAGSTPFVVILLLVSVGALALVARGRPRRWQAVVAVVWLLAAAGFGWALAAPAPTEGSACDNTAMEDVRPAADSTAACTDAARIQYAVGGGAYVALCAAGVVLLATRRRRDVLDSEDFDGARGSGVTAPRSSHVGGQVP